MKKAAIVDRLAKKVAKHSILYVSICLSALILATSFSVAGSSPQTKAINNFFHDKLWIGEFVELKNPKRDLYLRITSVFDRDQPTEIAELRHFPPAARLAKWPTDKSIRIMVLFNFQSLQWWDNHGEAIRSKLQALVDIEQQTGLNFEIVQPLEDTDNYKTLFQHADVVLTVEPYIPSIDSRLSKRLEIKKYVPVLKFSPQKEKRLSGYMVLDKSGNIKKANCKTHDVEAPLEDNFLKRCLLMSLGLNNIDDVHDPQYALNLLYSSKLRSGMNKQELMSALDKIEEER